MRTSRTSRTSRTLRTSRWPGRRRQRRGMRHASADIDSHVEQAALCPRPVAAQHGAALRRVGPQLVHAPGVVDSGAWVIYSGGWGGG